MRPLRSALILLLLVLAVAGCVGKQLPPGYEALKTETALVEASKYIAAMRDQYVQARQRGLMTPAQFQQAVKADQALTAVWNQYIAAVRVKTDDAKLWSQVIRATATLENILLAYIPGYAPANRPPVLGQ